MKVDAKTYILSKISEIVKQIPTLKVLYKIDTYNREHLIKVLPVDIFYQNQDYHKLEEAILFDFIDNFPYDNLVFFSDDDWIDFEDSDEVLIGLHYDDQDLSSTRMESTVPSFIDNDLFVFSGIDDDIINLSDIIEEYSYFKLVDTNSIIEDFNNGWLEIKTPCTCNESGLQYGSMERNIIQSAESTIESDCKCENYAIAA